MDPTNAAPFGSDGGSAWQDDSRSGPGAGDASPNPPPASLASPSRRLSRSRSLLLRPASAHGGVGPDTEVLGVTLTRVELERTALLFGLLFLAALLLVVGRTARDALFLSRFPVGWVAPMWIVYGVSSSVVGLGYARVADRLPRARFTIAFALFGAVSYALLRFLIGKEIQAAYLVFYIWSEIIANFAAVLVWAIAQDLHDPRSAKRLFGLIGAGRVVGTVTCGLGAGAIAPLIGTQNLILVLIVALLAVAWLTRVLAVRHPAPPALTGGEPAIEARLQRMPVWRSRYALSVALFTLVLFMVLTVGDCQFKAIATAIYPSRDDLARFMGFLYGAIGVLGLFVQFAIMPGLLRRYGVLGGMLLMPVAFVAATAVLLGYPSLALASILKASDNGLQFTVHDATTQLLLFPFPPALRERVRTLASAIAKPLGYGVGALVLMTLAPAARPDLDPIEQAARLGLWSLPLGLAAIALTPLVRRGYLDAMRRTLIRRESDSTELVYGEQTRAIFEEALRSPDSPQVLFAIEQLERLDPRRLGEELPALAQHPSARVRSIAVRLAAELEHPAGPELARAALADRSARVRVAAVESLAALLREDAHDELLAIAMGGGPPCTPGDPQSDPPLNEDEEENEEDDEEALRAAAIAALVRYCGLDGMLDGASRLRALLDSPSPRDRIAAARVLGMVGRASLQRSLARLLTDADPGVRRAAVRAAASVADGRLLPLLLDALADRALALSAARALAALGDDAIPDLAAHLADPAAPRAARLALPRVLARLGTADALAVLLAHLDEPDEAIRQKILASASRLRHTLGAPPAPLATVRARIDRELSDHERARDEYLAVRPLVAGPLLDQHVIRRLRKGLVRVLRLCELVYPREAVALARAHLFGPDPALRANAFEVLESLLDLLVRERLAALIDRFLDLSAGRFPTPARPAGSATPWVRRELAWGDPYSAALALDAVAQRSLSTSGLRVAASAPYAPNPFAGAAEDALAATSAKDPLVREAAAIALAVTRPPGAAERLAALVHDEDPVVARYAHYWVSTGKAGLSPDDAMYTTIEKILFLQRVPVFSRVAGDDLVALARGSIVVSLQKGDVVFRQGEPGFSLYLIISGEISLEMDGREIARLGPHDVFGEMSIFDREPRTSTAVIAEDAELLRVSADDFHEAVHETVEIAEAVIQVLNRRLREADHHLVEARARLSILAPPEPSSAEAPALDRGPASALASPPSQPEGRREEQSRIDDPDLD